MGIYTWGQLRQQLQQTSPAGRSLDLIDSALNTSYVSILQHRQWSWLETSGNFYIETAAPYVSSTDTISVTQGSASVIGNGTSWVSGQTGLKLIVGGGAQVYTFTVVDATHATLDRVFEGGTSPTATYRLYTNVYDLPPDFKERIDVCDANTGLPLLDFDEQRMDETFGARTQFGGSGAFAIKPSSVASDGGNSWVIELYPIELLAKGYLVNYRRVADAFDGENTGAAPLSFVTDLAILSGARMHLAALPPVDAALMTVQKGLFDSELWKMTIEDLAKHPPQKFEVASHYTAHRIERVARTYRRYRQGC